MATGNLRSVAARDGSHGTARLSSLAARVEHALFAATLAGMAYLCFGPLLAQAV
jgi:hypothetical protein